MASLQEERNRIVNAQRAAIGLLPLGHEEEGEEEFGAIEAGRILAALNTATEVFMAIRAGIPRPMMIEVTGLLNAFLGFEARETPDAQPAVISLIQAQELHRALRFVHDTSLNVVVIRAVDDVLRFEHRNIDYSFFIHEGIRTWLRATWGRPWLKFSEWMIDQ